MPIDYNDAPEQREFGALIPDGSFCYVQGKIRPGGATIGGLAPCDNGLFLKSKTEGSDVYMLDWEFTVLNGPHAKQKIWQYFVVIGGEVDDKGQSKAGNITKALIRGMIDSAFGLSKLDMTDAAKARRRLEFVQLDNIPFVAKISIEPDRTGEYPDKNRIAVALTIDDPEYGPTKAGTPPDPVPRQQSSRRGGTGHTAAPPPPAQPSMTFAPPAAAPPPVAQPAPAAPPPPAPPPPIAAPPATFAAPPPPAVAPVAPVAEAAPPVMAPVPVQPAQPAPPPAPVAAPAAAPAEAWSPGPAVAVVAPVAPQAPQPGAPEMPSWVNDPPAPPAQ